MKNDYTLKDVLEQIETTESEIDYLKRVFQKAENRIDEIDRKTYQDYIWKLEDTILEFKTELEESTNEK